MVMYFDHLSQEAITGVNIPTGVPLVYEFDDSGNALRHYYLGDTAAIEAKMNAVAAQGKAKKASLTARRAPGKTQLPVLAGSCVRCSLFTHLHLRQLSQQPRHFFFLGRKSSHRKYPAMGASSA